MAQYMLQLASVTVGGERPGTYHIRHDPQIVNKRPPGPPARQHRLVDNPSDLNDTRLLQFPGNGEPKGAWAHADAELSVLESCCWKCRKPP